MLKILQEADRELSKSLRSRPLVSGFTSRTADLSANPTEPAAYREAITSCVHDVDTYRSSTVEQAPARGGVGTTSKG
jgi:hypothetical protein